MKARILLVAAVTAAAGLVAAPATASASASPSAQVLAKKHACTLTSTHHCIRGGEFCPQSKYGQSGWDAQGRRYVCKGDHTHPHWMKP